MTVRDSYDRVADEYVRRIYDELQHKPLDRELLDRFAARVRDRGAACDLGCGPGHVTRYLHEQGVQIHGMDLSGGMIERARRLNPEIEFTRGDMLALDVEDSTWVAIAAFYSIVNLSPEQVASALQEMHRVLKPGGLLLLSFHIGDHAVHFDEWWGYSVSIAFYFFRPDWVSASMRDAGFEIEEIIERDPYPDVEHQSRRAYVFARKSVDPIP